MGQGSACGIQTRPPALADGVPRARRRKRTVGMASCRDLQVALGATSMATLEVPVSGTAAERSCERTSFGGEPPCLCFELRPRARLDQATFSARQSRRLSRTSAGRSTMALSPRNRTWPQPTRASGRPTIVSKPPRTVRHWMRLLRRQVACHFRYFSQALIPRRFSGGSGLTPSPRVQRFVTPAECRIVTLRRASMRGRHASPYLGTVMSYFSISRLRRGLEIPSIFAALALWPPVLARTRWMW